MTDENYLECTRVWIEQEEARLEELELNDKFLIEEIRLKQKQLYLNRKQIDLLKKGIKDAKKILKK